MFQTERRGSGSRAGGQAAARPPPDSEEETRAVAAGKSVSRVLEVHRPWLQKGLDAIASKSSPAAAEQPGCCLFSNLFPVATYFIA